MPAGCTRRKTRFRPHVNRSWASVFDSARKHRPVDGLSAPHEFLAWVDQTSHDRFNLITTSLQNITMTWQSCRHALIYSRQFFSSSSIEHFEHEQAACPQINHPVTPQRGVMQILPNTFSCENCSGPISVPDCINDSNYKAINETKLLPAQRPRKWQ